MRARAISSRARSISARSVRSPSGCTARSPDSIWTRISRRRATRIDVRVFNRVRRVPRIFRVASRFDAQAQRSIRYTAAMKSIGRSAADASRCICVYRPTVQRRSFCRTARRTKSWRGATNFRWRSMRSQLMEFRSCRKSRNSWSDTVDGIHDLGGKEGFGPVVREQNEPIFHAAWEVKVFTIVRAAVEAGARSNIDQARHAIDRTHPIDDVNHTYYGQCP